MAGWETLRIEKNTRVVLRATSPSQVWKAVQSIGRKARSRLAASTSLNQRNRDAESSGIRGPMAICSSCSETEDSGERDAFGAIAANSNRSIATARIAGRCPPVGRSPEKRRQTLAK